VNGQTRYLLDTNVVSETRKPRPDPGVIAFLQATEPDSVFISVLTLGELRKGVAAIRLRDPDPNAATRFAAWVEGMEVSFSNRIWGEWSADRPRPVVDTILAATAVVNDLTLVTRNIRDVRDTPVKLLDPWTE
jgi:predicted nucleic acid-binding protein